MRFCPFLQTETLTGPCPGNVRALGQFCSVRFRTLRGLGMVRKAAARLLLCFATVQVLGFLEGQQIGLLLLQLPLELLGLALLLELPPLILLRAGRITLNQNSPGRLTSERFILTTQPRGSRFWSYLLTEPKVSISFGLWFG